MNAAPKKPLIVFLFVLGLFMSIHVGLYFGGKVDGFFGEICRKIQGFSITPFFMEIGFVAFGGIILLGINAYRRQKEGDEYVYLEEVSDVDANLPENSRSILLSQRETVDPLDSQFAAIEGSLELKDYAQASELWDNLEAVQQETPQAQLLKEKINSLSS